MSLLVVSHSTIVSHAIEESAKKYFDSIKIFNRLDAIEELDDQVQAILFDMSTVEFDVEELLQFDLRCKGGLAKVLVMTREDQNLRDAIPLVGKVCAILPHNSQVEEILVIARALYGGLSIIPTHMLPMLNSARTRPHSLNSAAVSGLSPRQEAVLAMLGEGHSNKVIARALNINDTTVRVHVRAVLKKLGVNNRTQAALIAGQYVPPK
jgi:two-component system, NarL family, nitrate/nitrite response regulator NarL